MIFEIILAKAIAEGLTALAEKLRVMESKIAGASAGLTTAELQSYASQATNVGTKLPNEVVLGKLIEGSSASYEQVAKSRGSGYFWLNDWDNLNARLGYENMWEINKQYLANRVSEGRTFVLVHDPSTATGSFLREIEYLKSQRYADPVKYDGYWRMTK